MDSRIKENSRPDDSSQVIIPEVMPGREPVPPRIVSENAGFDGRKPFFPSFRMKLAFGIAVVSDVLSILDFFAPPVQIVVDFTTAVALFIVLGWKWSLLVGLIMEAIPGVSLFPAWTLVVGAIAAFGSPRSAFK